MTDLDLDAIEASHPDEPGINPFVRPLVAALREARAERDNWKDIAGDCSRAVIAAASERDEARAERDAFLAALGAIATLPSASIAVRDIARHALLNGGAA